MSVDFANVSFFTKVSCSCVSSDDHAVNNLISKERRGKSVGFQGERFVRVPVTVQFQFYVPVDIQRIDFLPFVGRQCAKVIQLHVSKHLPLAAKNDASSELLGKNYDNKFRKAGSVLLSKPAAVSFINRAYKPHPCLSGLKSTSSSLESFTNGDMGSATALRIVILSMLEGSVPSLSGVHIWGKPGHSCPRSLVKEVFDISQSIGSEVLKSDSPNIALYEPHTSGDDRTCSRLSSDHASDMLPTRPSKNTIMFDCPAEFLDPLTFEMMTMPVLLPSGHTVDRKTLDKHVRSQSEMGNIPSDPFTGIPFTDSAKPTPNVKLKVRMDAFTLEFSKVNGHCQPTCNLKNGTDITSSSTKRRKEHKHGGKKRCTSEVVEVKCVKGESTAAIAPSEHSDELSSSLDTALASVGRGRVERMVTVGGKDSTLHCTECKSLMSSTSYKYRLACSHIICYPCSRRAAGNSKILCLLCLSSSESKSIRRIHN